MIYIALMVPVAVIDWKHFIIPNEFVVGGLVAGIGLKMLLDPDGLGTGLTSAAASFVLLFGIRRAGTRMFKKEALGFGDVKLAAVIGLFTGFHGFLIALWLGSLLGLGFAMIRQNGREGDTRVPLGSFMAIASTVVVIFRENINYLAGQWQFLMR